MGNKASSVRPQAQRAVSDVVCPVFYSDAVATHLSAAKEAEKHVNAARREHKKDPITQHLKSADLVTNMMSLDMISNRPEEAATPSGSVVRGARRKQAGLQRGSAPKAIDSYGVTETELRSLLIASRAIIAQNAGAGATAANSNRTSELAAQFRLKPEDVALLVRYNASVVSSKRSEYGGQSVAHRPF